jgi:hypothetical protein
MHEARGQEFESLHLRTLIFRVNNHVTCEPPFVSHHQSRVDLRELYPLPIGTEDPLSTSVSARPINLSAMRSCDYVCCAVFSSFSLLATRSTLHCKR